MSLERTNILPRPVGGLRFVAVWERSPLIKLRVAIIKHRSRRYFKCIHTYTETRGISKKKVENKIKKKKK